MECDLDSLQGQFLVWLIVPIGKAEMVVDGKTIEISVVIKGSSKVNNADNNSNCAGTKMQ